MKQELTQKKLKELMDYDPDTGIFTRKLGMNKVGSIRIDGRLQICVNYKMYLAHRLAWLYVYGELPIDQIDHINCNPLDNSIKNLRLASGFQNMQNIQKAFITNKTAGLLGASFHKAMGKYRSRICLNNKTKVIGYYDTAEDAHNAYVLEKRKIHDFCEL